MRLMPRSSAVPLHRRWIADIIHFGRKAHTAGADLVINVAAAAARTARQPPISWVSIWVRVVGLVGQTDLNCAPPICRFHGRECTFIPQWRSPS
jgi:hypothetical protein